MNIREIINWGLQHWRWLAVSVAVCLLIGGIYYVRTAPTFAVNATLMLRQTADEQSNQSEMMKLMGVDGNKVAGDEVQILTSRDLMGQVVDKLNLTTTYSKKGTFYWKKQFPASPVTVSMATPNEKPVSVVTRVRGGKAKATIKVGRFHKQKISSITWNTPIQTIAGEITFTATDLADGSYKAVILPRIVAIDQELKAIQVTRMGRESNIITFSTKTSCPDRAIATINTLLDFYNQQSAMDKNRLASQTEQFLSARIAVVTADLNTLEQELENYKRVNRISNLNSTADRYQQTGDQFLQQAAQLEAEQSVLDFVAEQVAKSENEVAVIPGNLGVSDPTLQHLIQDYNLQAIRINALLETATETNPVVMREKDVLNGKRVHVQEAINQARQTLSLQRKYINEQQNLYNSRLEQIPETERRYVEMQRDKATKENQYLFLIEKREENALLLASEAVPAKIVDRAQLNPNKLAPKLSVVGLMAILFGLIIPYCFYFLGVIRKELQ